MESSPVRLASISCVLLAYHEEEVIEESIRKATKILEKVTDLYEIIVVGYQGCEDKTNEIVRRLAQRDDRIRLILQRTEEKGYGRALYLGIKGSRYDWIFQSDADGQFIFEDLLRLLPHTEDQKVALIHGYRAPRNDPFERLLFAGLYNGALRLLYGMPVRDIDSAFKLILGPVARRIHLHSLTSFAVAELIIKIKKQGLRIIQVPVRHCPRTTGVAMAQKSIPNPLNLELPSVGLVWNTLGEMVSMRNQLR